MLDLIIRNGQIIDGSGSPGFIGDLGIKDGRIAAIGRITEAAKETIDATGRVISPGFVDVHTHYDAQVFWDGTLSPSCYHGVTTIFGGHCGFSIAPLSKEAAPYLLNMLSRVEGMPANSLAEGVPWDWETFGEYLGKLDGNLGVNAGFMAGHSAIRRVVMGERAVGEKATPAELEKMKALLAQSLSQGAMGFSSTVSPTHNDADGNPVPSRHASREELIELARVCRDYEGTSLEFLPAVGRFSQDIKQLMSDLSTAAQRPLNWNALNAGDPETMQNQLSASDLARSNGGDVRALTIPQPITLRINLFAGFVFDALNGWDESVPHVDRRSHRVSREPGEPTQSSTKWRVPPVRCAASPIGRTSRCTPRSNRKTNISRGVRSATSPPIRTNRRSTRCSTSRSPKVCAPRSCRPRSAATPRSGRYAASCGRTNAP